MSLTYIDEDDDENQEDFLSYKIILLGDTSVGKTSLIVRFCDSKFFEVSTSTIGVDTKTKYVRYNGQKIELEIWDTAGQERFKSLAKNCFQGADGIILMYDITNKKTFHNIKNWYNNIKDSIDINKVALIIVGNKIDLPEKEVKKEITEKYCEENNLELIETSCKNNENVEETFKFLIEKMIQLDDDYKQQCKKRKSKVDENTLSSRKNNKKKCCHS